jgi:hypothetical protein
MKVAADLFKNPAAGGAVQDPVAGGAVDLPSSASSSSHLKGRSKGQYSPPLSPDLGAQLPSLPPWRRAGRRPTHRCSRLRARAPTSTPSIRFARSPHARSRHGCDDCKWRTCVAAL